MPLYKFCRIQVFFLFDKTHRYFPFSCLLSGFGRRGNKAAGFSHETNSCLPACLLREYVP